MMAAGGMGGGIRGMGGSVPSCVAAITIVPYLTQLISGYLLLLLLLW